MYFSPLRALLDAISPRQCMLCYRVLGHYEQLVCSDCLPLLPYTGFENEPKDNPLVRLLWGLVPVEKGAALFHYSAQSEVADLIYDLKYAHHPATARQMGQILTRHFAPSGFFDDIDLLVPVPLTKGRERQRGYNQSLEIALGISIETHLDVEPKALRRVHFGGSQTQLSAQERSENVKNAFALRRPKAVMGKHILLVDDIITTGATLMACIQQLLPAHPASINVVTLGIAGDHI